MWPLRTNGRPINDPLSQVTNFSAPTLGGRIRNPWPCDNEYSFYCDIHFHFFIIMNDKRFGRSEGWKTRWGYQLQTSIRLSPTACLNPYQNKSPIDFKWGQVCESFRIVKGVAFEYLFLQLWSISKRKNVDENCISEVIPTRDSELLQTLCCSQIKHAVYRTPCTSLKIVSSKIMYNLYSISMKSWK